MPEVIRMWTEVSFNVAYLIVVWALTIAMARKLKQLSPQGRALGRLFAVAFGLLAVGDTGHVGLRALSYALGGLENNLALVRLGVISTAITITFFYAVMLMIWHERYQEPYGWFGYLLFAAAIVRLGLLTFPQNEWNSIVPPRAWSLYRNLPLVVQGLGAAYLILRDALREDDKLFKWVGIMILISYGFYAPVILFVRTVPIVGMLMIPKTVAYVGIAILAYWGLFRSPTAPKREATA